MKMGDKRWDREYLQEHVRFIKHTHKRQKNNKYKEVFSIKHHRDKEVNYFFFFFFKPETILWTDKYHALSWTWSVHLGNDQKNI